MKKIIISMALLLLVSSSVNCATRRGAARIPSARGQVVVDVGIFYDSLAPYGRWYEVDEFGWVWTPYDIAYGWRPYTNGYWVFTDYGWTWVSNFSWGWAPFHYGRWRHHARHGWIWIPGRVWAPAWVVWRQSPGWLGWGPMPPQRGWRVGMDFDIWDDPGDALGHFAFSFVEERNFAARNLHQHLALNARNVTLIQNTRSITSYERRENRVINRSFDADLIERAAGRSIPRQRVIDSDSPQRSPRVSGNEVQVYRPNVTPARPDRTPPTSMPQRQRPASPADLTRREEDERRRLKTEQARERAALDAQHRQQPTRVPRQLDQEQIRKQQEAERRALDEQIRRERDTLKNRQDARRQVEPPASKAPQRQPSSQQKKPPTRKPPE